MISHRLLNVVKHNTGWDALGVLRGGEWHNPIYLLEGSLWLLYGEQFVGGQEWLQGDQVGVYCYSPGSVDGGSQFGSSGRLCRK